jgi:hypothetical protein
MTLGDSIRSILLANSTVSGLVGTRIYPQELPLQCTLPALVYSFPSDPFKIHMRSARCQISCYANGYNERENLKQAVENALKFFSGLNSGITIEIIFPIGQYEHVKDNTSKSIFAPIDFKVNYYTN